MVKEPIPAESGQDRRQLRHLYVAFGLLTAGMLLFAQTQSCLWDEGFHLLAAQLIDHGKRPYLDFMFAQTPLNAYWNAGWMAVFGQSWRVVHAVATLATVVAIVLLVQYLRRVFAGQPWQSAAAFTGLALFGLHARVWKVGTIAQAYPLCLLLLVLAFRVAIREVARQRIGGSTLAGLLCGVAASASLLAAPAAPVLLIWMWVCNRAGNRWAKSAAFLAGGAVACVPLLIFLAKAPHQVWFDVLQYHALYRRLDWEGAFGHDIGVLTDWVNSSPNLLLALLAAAGLLSLKRSTFDAARRSEFWLCLWLALAFAAQNAFARPTFPMYFAFMIPFLAVLGTVGFHAVVTRLHDPGLLRPAVWLLLGITTACLASGIYADREHYTWPQFEQVAAKMKQVTPEGAPFLASEQVYFLMNWPVPPGMEYDDSHKLRLPAADAAAIHTVNLPDVEEQIKAGRYASAEVCDDEGQLAGINYWKKYYAQTDEVVDCEVYSQPIRPIGRPPQ